jgi:cellulose synthase/poly-beta-1,6-N-acetylglucosamine synthase-like glycosyltransferase
MLQVILTLIAILFLIGYTFLIETYRRWFLKVPMFNAAHRGTNNIKFTIVIPARNEEEIIEKCLTTVLSQTYSALLFEVIVIDDHSTDSTAEIVMKMQQQHHNLRLIQLETLLHGKQLNSYKKKAIEYAVTQSTGDWIVATDADCFVNRNWLQTFAAFIDSSKSVFVAAPVKFKNLGSFVSIFQCLDFISLQGITAASVHQGFHSMCNGANLAYNKKVFEEVGGFKGIDNIASGDDMLLMHKIFKRYPEQIGFLLSKDAIVETLPMQTWKSFFNQRIRWASKADKFEDKRIFWVLMLVYIFNVSFIVLPFIAFWHSQILLYWVVMLLAKTIIELRFVYPVSRFFNQQNLLAWFPVMQPVHIVYTVIAGWLGKFGKYTWKGRTVR